MTRAYYNEINEYAASQLRSLIRRGYIADGDVDTRDIRDVQPDDLRGYAQCHFFAGIGAWSHALRLVQWPDSRPVWTGSPPCQPFSVAGKGKAQKDDRHLWPQMFRLIRKRRPKCVFGEQVGNAIGRGWLDGVSDDLESENYAIGSAVLRACSVGAPHERKRLYWCAKALADAARSGQPRRSRTAAPSQDWQKAEVHRGRERTMGNALCAEYALGQVEPARQKLTPATGASLWAGEWRECADGKRRLFAPGVPLLADGPASRLAGPLTAYGNAIVPQVAAAFIEASDF